MMALFDNSAIDYDDWCETEIGNFVDSIEKNLMKVIAKPIKGEEALDLGCGTGIYSYWLLEQGLLVTGIDLSSAMLKMAKAKKDSSKIKFLQGDIHTLPFDDETFDLVVCNIVLEFTDNPKQIVFEALRVLKKGGRFVCGFIGKDSAWGNMYQERGNQNPTSVFSKANFFSHNDIIHLHSYPPIEIKDALYFNMSEFKDVKQAGLLEEERKKLNSKDAAGYIVAKWIKM